VDLTLFAPGKENCPPMMTLDKLAEERKLQEERQTAEAERRRVEAADAERRRAEAEVAAKAEAERLEKERLDALEAAEQSRLEEQRRLEERCRLEERHRLQEQQAHKAAERAERAKDEAARRKVQKFLKDSGFSGVNSQKTSCMSHTYALHAAVRKNDAETLGALLRCKADPSLQNSSRKTPEQLASSINKKGSHFEVLSVLRAHAH